MSDKQEAQEAREPQEASRRPPGGLQEASRRPPGGLQEASRKASRVAPTVSIFCFFGIVGPCWYFRAGAGEGCPRRLLHSVRTAGLVGSLPGLGLGLGLGLGWAGLGWLVWLSSAWFCLGLGLGLGLGFGRAWLGCLGWAGLVGLAWLGLVLH